MLLSRVRTWILAAVALWLMPVLAVGAEGVGLPLAAAIPLGACAGAGLAMLASRALQLLSVLAAGAPTRKAASSGLLVLTAFALAISSIPSPGNTPTTTWLWISLALVLGTIAVNLWAVIRAASTSTFAPGSRSDGAQAASATPLSY